MIDLISGSISWCVNRSRLMFRNQSLNQFTHHALRNKFMFRSQSLNQFTHHALRNTFFHIRNRLRPFGHGANARRVSIAVLEQTRHGFANISAWLEQRRLNLLAG